MINASCIFGGITIYVPDNVRVKVKSSSIFGGVDEKRKNNSDEKEFTVYLMVVVYLEELTLNDTRSKSN